MTTIVFSAIQDGYEANYEAEVSRIPWPRSLIGDGYLVVEHSLQSYVIIRWHRFGPFAAYPVDEKN